MKVKFARVAFTLLIWILTSAATARACVLDWRGKWEQAKDVLRLQDRAASAARGWDPRFTISAHCGAGSEHVDCRFCRFVRALLGTLHCDESRQIELRAVNQGGA